MADMSKFVTGTVVDRVDFCDDLCVMKFRPDRDVTFVPGQYATLAIERDGKLIQRPYSLVSAPHERDLEIYFELVPQGEMTPLIWDLKPNDTILIRQKIVGRFVLDQKQGKQRHLMAGTVTGGAPYISMVRAQQKALANGGATAHQFAIVLGASRSWELGSYLDELREAARDGWVQFHPTVSRPWEDAGWTGEVGRVEDVLRKYSDTLGYVHAESIGYACGHPDMIENVKGVLRRAGFPKERVFEEKFFQE